MREDLEWRGEAPGREAPLRQPHLTNTQASEPNADFRKVLISEGVDGRGSSLWLYYRDSTNTDLTAEECQFSLELQPAGGNETSARRILGTLSAPKG